LETKGRKIKEDLENRLSLNINNFEISKNKGLKLKFG
jgi:hypothetical protein